MCGGFASPMPLSNNYFYKPTALRGLHVGQDWVSVMRKKLRSLD
jgi:hypothetical protein